MKKEDAMKILRDLHDKSLFSVRNALETFIPELKESEDERIGNLIYCIVRDREDVRDTLEANGVSVDDALSYLEKQKEPKPGTTENNPINPFDTKLFQDGVKEGRRLEREDMQQEQKRLSGNSEKPNNQWSEDFEENIGNLLHDKLTWQSEDGGMSSTVLIDDKTLKDIVQGIWFYVGEEVLKYPNKKLNVTEWDEEDEEIYNSFKVFCQRLIENKKETFEASPYYAQKMLDWLKSLRPQPKQKDRYQEGFQDGVYEGRRRAWEEYNKSVAYHYDDFNHKLSCREGGPCINPFFDCIDCPRRGNSVVKTYTSPNTTEYQSWKPSEEQMTDLFIAAREGCEAGSPTSNTLKTLYKDLEKL